MTSRPDRFDTDFASPADYEDGFRESDAVRGERMMRKARPFERMQAMLAEKDGSGADAGKDREIGG